MVPVNYFSWPLNIPPSTSKGAPGMESSSEGDASSVGQDSQTVAQGPPSASLGTAAFPMLMPSILMYSCISYIV